MTASSNELATADQGFSLISNRKLFAIYSAMAGCHRIAESSLSRPNGRNAAGSTDSLLGHEAAVVGAAIDLLAQDIIAPVLRPEAALRAINPGAILAPGFSSAVRQALADQSSQMVGLYFSSCKAAAQASWLKALSLAVQNNLPILFVLLNQPEASAIPGGEEVLPLKRKGHPLPVINVDGNDAVAMYRVACESIAHARKGHGPTLIDCRLSLPADPIENMRKYLIAKGLNPVETAR